MNFTYTYNSNSVEIDIQLDPVSRQGTFYNKLTKDKAFVEFLNKYYCPELFFEEIEIYNWSFVILENKTIGFHIKMKKSDIDIHKFIEKLHRVAQKQLTEAISFYTKVLAILRIIQSTELS